MALAGVVAIVAAMTVGCADRSEPSIAGAASRSADATSGSPFSSPSSVAPMPTDPQSTTATQEQSQPETDSTTTSTSPNGRPGPQTYVIDDAAIGQAPTPVQLAARPGDRIEIHLVRGFYDYMCCDVTGDPGVLTAESGPTSNSGSVDGVYAVTGVGQATLLGQADPGCLQAHPACGSPSHRITVEVTSSG
jgi:hypothetical protein